MPILDPLYGTPLAVRLIPQVDRNFAEQLKLRDDQRSIGLLSVDNDDATYVAIDEATKMANVEVVYARSSKSFWMNSTCLRLKPRSPAENRNICFVLTWDDYSTMMPNESSMRNARRM